MATEELLNGTEVLIATFDALSEKAIKLEPALLTVAHSGKNHDYFTYSGFLWLRVAEDVWVIAISVNTAGESRFLGDLTAIKCKDWRESTTIHRIHTREEFEETARDFSQSLLSVSADGTLSVHSNSRFISSSLLLLEKLNGFTTSGGGRINHIYRPEVVEAAVERILKILEKN